MKLIIFWSFIFCFVKGSISPISDHECSSAFTDFLSRAYGKAAADLHIESRCRSAEGSQQRVDAAKQFFSKLLGDSANRQRLGTASDAVSASRRAASFGAITTSRPIHHALRTIDPAITTNSIPLTTMTAPTLTNQINSTLQLSDLTSVVERLSLANVLGAPATAGMNDADMETDPSSYLTIFSLGSTAVDAHGLVRIGITYRDKTRVISITPRLLGRTFADHPFLTQIKVSGDDFLLGLFRDVGEGTLQATDGSTTLPASTVGPDLFEQTNSSVTTTRSTTAPANTSTSLSSASTNDLSATLVMPATSISVLSTSDSTRTTSATPITDSQTTTLQQSSSEPSNNVNNVRVSTSRPRSTTQLSTSIGSTTVNAPLSVNPNNGLDPSTTTTLPPTLTVTATECFESTPQVTGDTFTSSMELIEDNTITPASLVPGEHCSGSVANTEGKESQFLNQLAMVIARNAAASHTAPREAELGANDLESSDHTLPHAHHPSRRHTSTTAGPTVTTSTATTTTTSAGQLGAAISATTTASTSSGPAQSSTTTSVTATTSSATQSSGNTVTEEYVVGDSALWASADVKAAISNILAETLTVDTSTTADVMKTMDESTVEALASLLFTYGLVPT